MVSIRILSRSMFDLLKHPAVQGSATNELVQKIARKAGLDLADFVLTLREMFSALNDHFTAFQIVLELRQRARAHDGNGFLGAQPVERHLCAVICPWLSRP